MRSTPSSRCARCTRRSSWSRPRQGRAGSAPMLVRCERCRAAFAVPDALRGRQGLQVECGRCLLVFQPRFEKDRSDPALLVRTIPPERKSRLAGWRTALAAAAVLALLGGGFAQYWRTRPPRLTKAAE